MGIKTRVTFAAAVAIAVAFLPEVEDTKYNVYMDIAGVPTVCEGITGPDVIKGKTYTRSECDALLTKHIRWRSEPLTAKSKSMFRTPSGRRCTASRSTLAAVHILAAPC